MQDEAEQQEEARTEIRLTMKDAVKTALVFLQDMFPRISEPRLEEVESHGPVWRVVLSFVDLPASPLQLMVGQTNRIFKVVEVAKGSGQAVSLKVWKE